MITTFRGPWKYQLLAHKKHQHVLYDNYALTFYPCHTESHVWKHKARCAYKASLYSHVLTMTRLQQTCKVCRMMASCYKQKQISFWLLLLTDDFPDTDLPDCRGARTVHGHNFCKLQWKKTQTHSAQTLGLVTAPERTRTIGKFRYLVSLSYVHIYWIQN